MKKVILAAMVAFSSLAANAQVWVGGSLGFDIASPEVGESTTTFTIAPEVGYTLNEKWDIAIALNDTYKSCDGESANSISVEPYARYTFAQSGKASFFVDGGFGFGREESLEGEEAESFHIGLRPGLKVALSEKFTLVTTTGWLGYKNVKDTKETFGFNVNNNALKFGLYYSF